MLHYSNQSLKYSLVLATIGRTAEAERFLESLAAQHYHNYELLVVDQNSDDRMEHVIARFQDQLVGQIKHLRCEPGLTRARNCGIQNASGDLIAFPDDDCVYGHDLLDTVAEQFLRHPEWDGLSGRPAGSSYYHRTAGRVTRYNAWKRGIEYAFFLRRELIFRTGLFDEEHGLGLKTRWWGGDGTDYLLAALDAGCRIYYDPEVAVEHPGPIRCSAPNPSSSLTRAYCYALGKGRVLRKRAMPLWFVAYQSMRPLCGALFSAVSGRQLDARSYWSASHGIVRGWLGYEQ
jgi:GT2 family glycosyltransferase